MAEYITKIAETLGINIWLFAIIFIWSMVWKLLGLWKSSRKNSVIWFIILAVFNTMGILPILYIFVFSKMKCCELKHKKNKKKKKK